jgi:hypothetical protein
MWKKTETQTFPGITPEAVWKIWKDIDNWTLWNEDLEESRLIDSFEKGGTFELKPKGGPRVKLTLEEVTENISFTDCLHLPGAKMHGHHEMKETEDGLMLVTSVSITGISSALWISMLGEKVAKKSLRQMEALIALIETK